MNTKLYSEYLDSKSETFSKKLKFIKAIEQWFDKNNVNLTSIDVTDDFLMDIVTVNTTSEFNRIIGDFENEFNLKCTRIFHKRTIIPDEDVSELWKFHFKEQ